MKKERLINNLIVIPIIILVVLVLYETTFKNVSITNDSKIDQVEEVKEVINIKEDNEPKDIELSREEAYKELISYNKIYNWMYMFVKDKNYEPAKKYEYKNPELRITPDAIKLNSDVYDVIDYKILNSERVIDRLGNGIFENPSKTYKDVIKTTIIKFKLVGGEATFCVNHNIPNDNYSFTLTINNLIDIYCANETPIQFYF